MENKMVDLSIVIPVYNEEKNIPIFYNKLNEVIQSLKLSYEIVFADDGSKDNTIRNIEALQDKDNKVKLIQFRKNFGNSERVSIVHALLEELPIEPESIDALICYHVLTHIKEVHKVLDNFYTILRNGGYALLEFTSKKDSTYGQGGRLSDREFLQHGVYLRYDEPDDIGRMVERFEFVSPFTSEYITDPSHGSGYIREKRHRHHSYFVVARK